MTAELKLTECGPLDGIWSRTGPRHVALRAAVVAVVAWLPLLVMSLLEQRHGGDAAVTFFDDLTVHVRLLLVAPLLILIEKSIGARTRAVATAFVASGLIRDADQSRYHEIVRKAGKLAGSALAEAVVLCVTVVATWMATRGALGDANLAWFEQATGDGQRLSPVGWWYAIVSPFVAFFLLRWGWRYAVWCWFLRRVSRFDLRLVGTHPDRAGGLGFIALGQTSFAAIGFAASCVVAAAAATEVLHHGVALKTYQPTIAGFVVLSTLFGLAPSLLFAKTLALTKRAGLLRYGDLATRYAHAFEARWLGAAPPGDDDLLGTGDIQSLADLGAGFERLETMRVSPFDKRTVITFVVTSALPMLPLALTVMPLKEILQKLVQALV